MIDLPRTPHPRKRPWATVLSCLLLLAVLAGCDTVSTFFPERVMGYKPQYVSLAQIENITGGSPRTLRNPGRVLVYNNLLVVNELFEGVHIIDNTDPRNPLPLAFISILGCVEIDLKGSILYADNYTDLVTIDISNLSTVQVTSRTRNVFVPTAYPPASDAYFECPNSLQGVVVGWTYEELNNPGCYRP